MLKCKKIIPNQLKNETTTYYYNCINNYVLL